MGRQRRHRGGLGRLRRGVSNTSHAKGWSILIALVGLWVPAAVNLAGIRSLSVVQVITTVLKSVLGAISAAAAIALFAYIGIETASVAAGRIVNPRRNVGRATVFGTLACAVVYFLGTVAVFGTASHDALVVSTAPFTDAANAIFGGDWAGDTVAVAAIVSGFGALVGWTLIVGEMPQAAARHGLFPDPFARESRRGVPAYGIVAGTLLASVLTWSVTPASPRCSPPWCCCRC